jgi:hypothetical protein
MRQRIRSGPYEVYGLYYNRAKIDLSENHFLLGTRQRRSAKRTTIIWSIGFHADYRWIELPIFDGKGYPGHHRGITTSPGLYFLGLPWQFTWGSGRFSGVARDARFLIEHIEAMRDDRPRRNGFALNEWALGP